MASMRSPIGSPDFLLLSSGARGGLVGEYGSVDDVGESAFENASASLSASPLFLCAGRAVHELAVEPCLVNAMHVVPW